MRCNFFSGNAVDQRPLDLDGAAHHIDHARKLHPMRPWYFAIFG
jgi:hypothetical protein